MKKIVLLVMVFITNFLGAQSVDPETFPALTSGIGIKYLYTNTGGEGKILVDSIKNYIHQFTQNGLTYTSSGNTELGGILNQNTTIELDGYNFFLNSGYFTGNGTASGHSNTPFNVSFMGANKPSLQTIISNLSRIDGSGVISSNMSLENNSTQKRVDFIMEGDTISGNVFSQWRISDNANASYLDFFADDARGFYIEYLSGLDRDIFTLRNILKYKKRAGNEVLELTLPKYSDDADAGANGLSSGEVYQTSGAGASPLNVAGIVMIKQ